MSVADPVFLEAAIELAELGRMTCAPNPPVGCLVVRNGQIIGRGYHQTAGEGHAEVNAIADAGGDVAGATVYVSLEPCAFVGRTPACAQTLIDAQVARVVVAAVDPHPRVAGQGIAQLQNAGIEVGVLSIPRALDAIAGYVARVTRGRPIVRIKTASSLDGATALSSGESQWITGAAARADVQYWRARSDAIITGVATVIDDDPALTVRDAAYQHARAPLRVVLDHTLRTPPSAKILKSDAPTLIVHNADVTPAESLRLPGVEFLALTGGPANLHSLLEHLAERGCNDVLVEAGAKVVGSFVAAQLWDEWIMYIAPKWLGEHARALAGFDVANLSEAPHGQIRDTAQIGADLRLRLTPTTDPQKLIRS
jgi:diaminohydroxyphosphoribosylaminopyrimidine deaminase/5-amino-6-(5-phosphoribosylamino)uracil reductase